jgi:oligopeptide/dipeptide ABC transporter ATP-binding protein
VPEPLLAVRNLAVEFSTEDGVVNAVNGVSYDVFPGEVLGVVGESGSGKSVGVMSLLGLIPQPPGKVTSGEAIFDGTDLLKMSKRQLRNVRGDDVAMVFQDPMTSLNPVLRIGDQLGEAISTHRPQMKREQVKQRVIDLLELVGVPNPRTRYTQYPHEFSGGMRQRAMIAMAIANEPKLLIADEPTTALDVTIQAQVIEVLKAAQEETHAATILITHDLGLVAELCDRVAVMYAGRIVEIGPVRRLFTAPAHPYTQALLASIPRFGARQARLTAIAGQPPDLATLPAGCAFAPRCPRALDRCTVEAPPETAVAAGHATRCWLHVPA